VANSALNGSRPVKVVVINSLSDDQLRRIADVDPRAPVADAAAQLLEQLPAALRPGQTPAPLRPPARPLDELLSEAEVILAARQIPIDLASRAPRLRWIQLPMSGTEGYKAADIWTAPDLVVTNAAGISAVPLAEYVLMTMLGLAKNSPRMFANKAAAQWDRFNLGQLRGQTLGIVGLGAIGAEVARLAQPFGMNIIALRRHPERSDASAFRVLPPEGLHELLAASDYVVLSVPATEATVGMIGPEELAVMRPSSYLINVARGDVVDEAALIDALRHNRLAGAGLDVFRTEPLPDESRLWGLPNVMLSAHNAGLFDGYDDGVTDLFSDNLRRYLDGDPLLNFVDRSAGY
jgi:phosphoglycerate dehydrogenase-like enzyme